jgi:FMN-dependent NADH-azoreductase
MSTVLVLTSSALGAASVSNHLVQDAITQLVLQDLQLRVFTRDLGGKPIPHLTIDSANALRGAEPANAAQAAAQALSDELIAELKAADTLVIGAPMYNFGIASTLKTWFDYVLRAGITFKYSESGPVGLLEGKRVIVIETRGGLYSEGPAQVMDSQEPHLRNLLSFMGITNVKFFRAEKLAFGPEAREQAIDAARAQLTEAIQKAFLEAA